jgi:uncharacterized membrane protein YbhN (UPF0104 family)
VSEEEAPAEATGIDEGPPERQKVAWWKSLIGLVVSGALIYWVFFQFLPSKIDFNEVADAFGNVDPPYWALIVGVTAAWLTATWWTIAITLPGMRLREAVLSNLGSTTVNNTVPVVGGVLALGVNLSMYYSWGLPPDAYALGALVKGVWDNIVRFALPGIALVLYLVLVGSLGPGWTPIFWIALVALVAVAVLVVLLIAMVKRRDFAVWLARWANKVAAWVLRLIRRPETDIQAGILQFRDNLTLAVTGNAVKITLFDVGYQLLMASVLLVSLRAVGIDSALIPVWGVLLSWAFTRAVTVIPITPGNVGIAETLYILALTSLAGGDAAPPGTQELITAAVLLYRLFTYLLPILLGGFAYLFWTQNSSWRESVASRGWRTSVQGLVGPRGRVE